MNDLLDLYQEIILDHNRRPRNFGPLPGANRAAEGYNPLCGDRVTLRLCVEDGVIRDVAFEGNGCAISTASASVLTEAVKGTTVAEAEVLVRRMIALATGDAAQAEQVAEDPDLGSLAAFGGVSAYPSRVKCATLAWHALREALDGPKHAGDEAPSQPSSETAAGVGDSRDRGEGRA